ncbi:MAG: LamG domain-containing protein [Phycisphaerae bacterium]|nr:LamG domain-containing protein [Phycisphaerae bacterium]
MCRRLICMASLVLLLSAIGDCSADLIAHLGFDEGSGSVAHDTSGNGHDGTLNGDPQWVAGRIGGALSFDGSGDYVEIVRIVQDDFTLAAWIKTDTPGLSLGSQGYQGSALIWSDIGGVANDFILAVLGTKLSFFCGNPDTSVNSDKDVVTGEWVHVVAARSAQDRTIAIYINGELEKTVDHANSNPLNAIETIAIGGNVLDSRYYTGLIDDVRLFDHVLSPAEVLGAMEGEVWPFALGPNPEDGALHEDTWVTLSWTAGGFAVSHDVYFSDNLNGVNSGDEDTFQGNQTSTMFIAGFPGFPYPDGLVPGITYYWRIDEVNDGEPNSPWRGDVWSFSVPPKTAYSPDPADGAEFVDPNAVFTWTPGFGAKLHTVYMGTNFDDVNNAAGGMPLGSASYSPAALESEKVYYWRVDEFDAISTYKGDVWSFTTPGAVGNPQPANGAADVQMTATLRWTPADNAASHELYFGTDTQAVKNATTASPEYIGPRVLGGESYDPGGLAWDSSYAWRVDEVYPAETVKGLAWSFTTADFILVDDFESYNDIDPPDAANNRIFDKWIDGFGTTTNGALVGNDLPPYAEQSIVHGGAQSIPYLYDNTNRTSEATLTLVYPRDWTAEGVTKLSLWFRGASANSAELMFVALHGTAVVYHDDPAATQIAVWTVWVIDLTDFAGVDLSNVNTVTIGFGTKNNPAVGGAGTMYFDDIRLVR